MLFGELGKQGSDAALRLQKKEEKEETKWLAIQAVRPCRTGQ